MTNANLEWFGGNKEALDVYLMFIDLAHLWDDLVDKDVVVTEKAINNAFMIALVYLPYNSFYMSIQRDILPMWITVVSAYQVANTFERNKDAHGIEIGHSLRYAAGNIIAYIVHLCVGAERAAEIMPIVWKNIVAERFEDYAKDRLNDI